MITKLFNLLDVQFKITYLKVPMFVNQNSIYFI